MIHVLAYVDALALDWIDNQNTPFLRKLVDNEKTCILENVMGYSFAIQSTLLSGRLPCETEHWMPYMFSPSEVPYEPRMLAYGAKMLGGHLAMPLTLRRVHNAITSSFVIRKGAKIGALPWRLMDQFYVRPYYYMNELPAFEKMKTDFQDQTNALVLYFGPPIHRNPINELVNYLSLNRNVTNGQTLLIILYLDNLDGVGHGFGVGSSPWVSSLRKIDRDLNFLSSFLKTMGIDSNLAIFSDHQMCNAKYVINISHQLNLSGIVLPNDATVFIDATIALIWVNKESLRRRVLSSLDKIGPKRITVLDKQNSERLLERYGVLFKNRIYGDLIVQTMPNHIFFPNFYSDIKALTGVHGFLPSEICQQSFLIVSDSYASRGPKLSHVKDIRKLLDFWVRIA